MSDSWKQVAILVFLLILFLIGIFGLLGLRRNLTKAPSVQVSMEDVTYTDKDKIAISGTTDKNADLKINGQPVPVGNDGSFSFDQALSEGNNTVKIEATSNGKTTTVEKTVVRQAPASTEAPQPQEGARQPQAGGELNNSGPIENIMGTFGLTAILLSYLRFRKIRKAAQA